jgi:hypothetical protein
LDRLDHRLRVLGQGGGGGCHFVACAIELDLVVNSGQTAEQHGWKHDTGDLQRVGGALPLPAERGDESTG